MPENIKITLVLVAVVVVDRVTMNLRTSRHKGNVGVEGWKRIGRMQVFVSRSKLSKLQAPGSRLSYGRGPGGGLRYCQTCQLEGIAGVQAYHQHI